MHECTCDYTQHLNSHGRSATEEEEEWEKTRTNEFFISMSLDAFLCFTRSIISTLQILYIIQILLHSPSPSFQMHCNAIRIGLHIVWCNLIIIIWACQTSVRHSNWMFNGKLWYIWGFIRLSDREQNGIREIEHVMIIYLWFVLLFSHL